jgi:cytochrome c-type biogenesis protein CcmH
MFCALALAQDPGSGVIDGMPPGPLPTAVEIAPRTQNLSRHLRCPVCQGLSVADSTSNAAMNFQNRVEELVRVGYSDDQIYDYFVERYGEWILMEPKRSGINWLLYIAPGLALGLGLALSAAVVMQWRAKPDEVPLPSDEGLVPMDKYEAMLLAELEDDT